MPFHFHKQLRAYWLSLAFRSNRKANQRNGRNDRQVGEVNFENDPDLLELHIVDHGEVIDVLLQGAVDLVIS